MKKTNKKILIMLTCLGIFSPIVIFANNYGTLPIGLSNQRIEFIKNKLVLSKENTVKENPKIFKDILIGHWAIINSNEKIFFNLNGNYIRNDEYSYYDKKNKSTSKINITRKGKWWIVDSIIKLKEDNTNRIIELDVKSYTLGKRKVTQYDLETNHHELYIWFTEESDAKFGIPGLFLEFWDKK
jgi:hypothetical protein